MRPVRWLPLVAILACSQEPSGASTPTTQEASPVASAAAPSPTDGARCGASPLPDCPLQGFMKANALVAINARRFDRLEEVLRRVATLGPREYPEWSAMAKAGAEAAASGKLEGVRTACKTCHDAYRSAYRRDHRLDHVR